MSKEWTYGLVHQGDFREIEKREVTVGRSRTCDVRIGEPSVSRKHFRLLIGDGAMTLQDLGSSNGTYVNDDVVHDRRELTHGDRVTIGDIDVFVRIEAKADTRPFGLETRMLDQDELGNLQPPDDETAAAPALETPPGAPPETTSETTTTRPAPNTWPVNQAEPTPGLPLPSLATQEFDADALAALVPEPPVDDDDPASDASSSDPPPTTAGHAGPDAVRQDPHGTRLIQHDFLNLDPPPPQGTPPPPASLTPPPIQFTPAPEMPPMPPQASPSPKDESASAPVLDPALDDTDAPPRPVPPQPVSPRPAPSGQILHQPPPSAEATSDVEKTAALASTSSTTDAPTGNHIDLPLTAPPVPGNDDPATGKSGNPAGDTPREKPNDNGELLGSVAGFDETMIGLPARGKDHPADDAPPVGPAARPAPSTPPLRGRAGRLVKPQPAGFWIRFLAVLVDGIWTAGLGLGMAQLYGAAEDPIIRQTAYALAAAVAALVIVIGWSVWGTTPGKRLFRLYVCTTAGQPGIGPLRSLVRAVGYLLSILTLGIGFLLAAFGTKRALHDRLAGTYVARLG